LIGITSGGQVGPGGHVSVPQNVKQKGRMGLWCSQRDGLCAPTPRNRRFWCSKADSSIRGWTRTQPIRAHTSARGGPRWVPWAGGIRPLAAARIVSLSRQAQLTWWHYLTLPQPHYATRPNASGIYAIALSQRPVCQTFKSPRALL